jgi:hypothetical protein
MRRKWWISIVLAIVMAPFVLLSWLVGRPLAPAELPVHLDIAIHSAPGFGDEHSNLRANLRAASAARRAPQSQAVLQAAATRHVLPLPPRTAEIKPTSPETGRYLTLCADADFQRYIDETLPALGWRLRDQTAGHYTFISGDVLLGVSRRPYAGRARRLTVSLSPAPSN